MKNNNHNASGEGENRVDSGVLRLLIESLVDLITKLRIDLLQQGSEVLGKIREVNDSVDLIAREIQQQSERGGS